VLEIGKTTTLEVLRTVPMGLILGDAEDEVLLPKRDVPEGAAPGDVVEVFLYTDSEDRPIATTARPLVEAGGFASLRVVSVERMGAFLDWGLPKDLLLPFRSQLSRVRPDQQVVVYVYCDGVSQRPVATAKIERFLEPPPSDLREGQSVEILVYERTDLGSKAIVEGRFAGLLYREAGGRGAKPGTSVRGWVKQIRSDGKIDLTLQPSGRSGADEARDQLCRALASAGGRLELGDDSPPDEIRRAIGISKKAFKRAVGGLYRARLLRIGEGWIELTGTTEEAQESMPES
jgi:predicted RNA-binding protein (virulence factor B family)